MSTFTSGRDGPSLHAPSALMLILLLWLSHPVRADDFDFGKFRAMNQRERVAAVVAGVSAHDAALSNVEVEFDSQTILHATPEQNKPDGRGQYLVRRLDKATLFHVKHFDEVDRAKSTAEYDLAWDGSRQLMYERKPERIGLVWNRLNGYSLDVHYNHMLGFRRPWDGLSVAKFLDKGAAGITMEAEQSPDGSDQWLVATVKSPVARLTERYWIDPQQGFVLRRHEYAYVDGPRFNRLSTTVSETRLVDGVWVPAKVTERASTSAVPNQSSDVYTLKTVRVGQLKDGDARLALPQGVRVVTMAD